MKFIKESKNFYAALAVTGCFLFNLGAANAALAAAPVVSNKPLSQIGSSERTALSGKTKLKALDKVGKIIKPKTEKEKKKEAKELLKKLKKAQKEREKEEKRLAKERAKEAKRNKNKKKNNEEKVYQKPAANNQSDKGGRTVYAGIELPADYKTISIYGDAVATKGQAVALIKANNPQVRLACSVEELVDLYWQEAEREGVRPDLAMAQSFVETGFYKYGGDVHHHQNNFCGLGTTGNGVKGASFKTPLEGVRAHIQHLLAYTQTKRPSTKIVDPRYELAHSIRLERGVVNTWYGLNGTWAMGGQYCEKIMANYQKMLAMQADDVAEKRAEKQAEQKKDNKKAKENSHKMRDLVEQILRDDD